MRKQPGSRPPASYRGFTRRPAAGAVAILAAALALPALPAAGAAAAANRGGSSGRPAAAATGGGLRAWGSDESGQLGDGTTTNSDVPVKVKLPPGTRITSARAGCDHALALTRQGKVLAWGSNKHGQLGDGTTTSSDTPVRVMLPPGTKVKAIRAGCRVSLVLTSHGRVLAWGDNIEGQLGDGTTTSSDIPVRVSLPHGTKATAISLGEAHGLVLTSKHKVLAWGFNDNGQLGDGTTTNSDTPVRVRLPHGVKVTAIAAGGVHSLARTGKGKVLAWGDGFEGQLGNGTTTSSDIPVRVRLPKRTRVRGLFAGCFHSLALTTKGKLLAWGDNRDGQLGDGTVRDRLRPVRTRLPHGAKVTTISAACFHSLARTAKGHVLAWGINSRGELGDGSTANSPLPVRVQLPAGLAAIAIGAGPGADFSLAIVHRK